jgi:hypothetical protein
MNDSIKVYVGFSPDGEKHVSTTARNKRDCKRLISFLAARVTKQPRSWEYAESIGWTIQPMTLTKGHKE